MFKKKQNYTFYQVIGRYSFIRCHRPVEPEELPSASPGRPAVHHPRQLQLDVARRSAFQSAVLRGRGGRGPSRAALGGLVAQRGLEERQNEVIQARPGGGGQLLRHGKRSRRGRRCLLLLPFEDHHLRIRAHRNGTGQHADDGRQRHQADDTADEDGAVLLVVHQHGRRVLQVRRHALEFLRHHQDRRRHQDHRRHQQRDQKDDAAAMIRVSNNAIIICVIIKKNYIIII